MPAGQLPELLRGAAVVEEDLVNAKGIALAGAETVDNFAHTLDEFRGGRAGSGARVRPSLAGLQGVGDRPEQLVRGEGLAQQLDLA